MAHSAHFMDRQRRAVIGSSGQAWSAGGVGCGYELRRCRFGLRGRRQRRGQRHGEQNLTGVEMVIVALSTACSKFHSGKKHAPRLEPAPHATRRPGLTATPDHRSPLTVHEVLGVRHWLYKSGS